VTSVLGNLSDDPQHGDRGRPTISVVMATFNGAKFLEEQLGSLARQTRPPDELIVSDDGSEDGTVEVLKTFAETSPFPVRISENRPRKGYRENFTSAAAQASGDLIAFCDQDDIWSGDKLEKVEIEFADPSILLVHHNSRRVDNSGKDLGLFKPIGSVPRKSAPLTIDPWSFAYGFCQTFRRDLLSHSHLRTLVTDFYFDGEAFAHDQWFFFLAGALGKIAYIDEPLVDYRQHASNVSGALAQRSAAQRTGWPTHRRRSESIDGRLSALRRIEADLADDSPYRPQVRQAVEHYDRFARACAHRVTVYGGPTIWRRAASWLWLIAHGGYRRAHPWSFGAKSLARDALQGICLRRDAPRATSSGPDAGA
jgi:glycosyltransferase involved in cell wall biosynthesis